MKTERGKTSGNFSGLRFQDDQLNAAVNSFIQSRVIFPPDGHDKGVCGGEEEEHSGGVNIDGPNCACVDIE